MITTLAHAEEAHTDRFESLTHYGETWYIAIPAFLVVTVMIMMLVWLVSGKDFGAVLIGAAVWFLVAGFGLFSISPIVSGISIVIGMLVAGFVALAGLSTGK